MRGSTLLEVLVVIGSAVGVMLVALDAPGSERETPRSEAREKAEGQPPVADDAKAPPGVESRDGVPVIEYKPPRLGMPRARVAGAVRGASGAPAPLALVPDHVGETISGHPSLFWYIGARPEPKLETIFTLIEGDAIEPLVEAALPTPAGAGIQRIRLADHGVRLRPGVEYEWSVSLIPAAERRALDRVASGGIRRVPVPDAMEPDAAGFASHGLWYDALESASDGIEADPTDPALRGMRDALLRQARLDPALD